MALWGCQDGNSNSSQQPLQNTGKPQSDLLVLYAPEVEEIRVSPVVARKGYLNILEHKTNGWKKWWVVSINS